tara:strand:+ start:149 stop:1291 length:1143 start_codon:yes stop_codon:yes gene_type:complete
LSNPEAILMLADGTKFHGYSIGIKGFAVGEVVFNTSMTGYQEIITDPSYDSQIICFTNPHIGNTGINFEDYESNKIYASGIIIKDEDIASHNWREKNSLTNYLKESNKLAIAGIDTRRLTKILRKTGSQNACIITDSTDTKKAETKLKEFHGLDNKDLAIKVTSSEPYMWNEGIINIYNNESEQLPKKEFNVVAYDFGIKKNILRILNDLGCSLTVVPADYSVDKVMNMKPDGVFLSNGPGDPKACKYAIKNIQYLLENEIPMFGICLGFQLLALASGAKTVKMKFGHHGANHPVMNLINKKVFITSQNHGFMVDDTSLPSSIKRTHVSLFDGSLQGFLIKNKYSLGFQGHPEASPGPQDIRLIFKEFLMLMTEKKNAKK